MSNDLIKFADDADPGFGAYNDVDDDSLADGIGASYPLIKYKGKTWSLQYKGKNYIFTDPATGYASPFIDVIILSGAPTKSKAYFEKWEDDSHERPLCTSMDSITPDVGVIAKQSETCALCPRNEFKLNAEGKNVRECSDYKRLSVLPLPSQTEKLLGFPLLEPVFLRIPGGSLLNLTEMDTQARMRGLKYWAFITRIDFDPKQSYPKMQFAGIQKLTAAERPTIEQLRGDPRTAAILGARPQGMKQIAETLPSSGQVAAAQQLNQPAPVQHPEPAPQPQPIAATLDTAAVAVKLAAEREARIKAIRGEMETTATLVQPAQPKPQGPILELKANPVPPPAPVGVVTGLVPAATVVPPGGTVVATAQTTAGGVPVGQFASPDRSTKPLDAVSDTGEPEMADADIDARLAAMDLTA